jgi:hypothetical protein
MSILWFALIAAAGIGVLLLFGPFRWNWWLKGALSIVASFIVVLFEMIAAPATLGSSTILGFLNQSPTREFLLFAVMLLGMMARMLSLAIEERRTHLMRSEAASNPELRIDKWEFVYPMLFAVPTFGALLSQLQTESLSVPAVTLAFQNGFFWQTLFKSKLNGN